LHRSKLSQRQPQPAPVHSSELRMTKIKAETNARRSANFAFAAFLFALFGWINLEILMLGLYLSITAYRRHQTWWVTLAPSASESAPQSLLGGRRSIGPRFRGEEPASSHPTSRFMDALDALRGPATFQIAVAKVRNCSFEPVASAGRVQGLRWWHGISAGRLCHDIALEPLCAHSSKLFSSRRLTATAAFCRARERTAASVSLACVDTAKTFCSTMPLFSRCCQHDKKKAPKIRGLGR
jgi:hypothetical protein